MLCSWVIPAYLGDHYEGDLGIMKRHELDELECYYEWNCLFTHCCKRLELVLVQVDSTDCILHAPREIWTAMTESFEAMTAILNDQSCMEVVREATCGGMGNSG